MHHRHPTYLPTYIFRFLRLSFYVPIVSLLNYITVFSLSVCYLYHWSFSRLFFHLGTVSLSRLTLGFHKEYSNRLSQSLLTFSVTRLDNLWIFLMTIVHAKVGQIYGEFLALYLIHQFSSKNCSIYFLGNFWLNLGNLFSASGYIAHIIHRAWRAAWYQFYALLPVWISP